MAVDQVLLEQAALGVPQLRIYRWSVPTLSLGYFQRISERQSHPASVHCPMVRRTTGGGAILHDREITYSLALPWSGGTESVARQRQLYRDIHAAFAAMLRSLDVRAEICPASKERRPVPFLCFQRVGEGDVIVGKSKVIGSAQRRVKGALLQHGTFLLQASPAAPELPGIEDLSDAKFPPEAWAEMFLERVVCNAGWNRLNRPLSEDESQAAERLVAARFSSATWTGRR